MAIRKLEDLVTWIEAKKLAKLVFVLLAKLPENEKYILRKHLWECARNIPGNIAEGFDRFHFQESMQFYRIARGSLNELKSDAYLCLECQYWTQEELSTVLTQLDLVSKLINGLIGSSRKFQKDFSKKTS